MVIKTESLTKHYQVGSEKVEALKGINLSVEKGEFISIMGPSGSGKTTLMNIIGCLDTPTDGTYFLNNKSVSELSDDELAHIRNDEIGFVFQSFHLLARNSALENVMLPLKYAGENKKNAITRSNEALDKVGLSDRSSHSPSELSGGQQQRVAIARALVNKPSILFADEPTGNLDSKSGHEIMGILDELHAQGNTIILVTHEDDIAKHAKRTIRLFDGKITGYQIREQEKTATLSIIVASMFADFERLNGRKTNPASQKLHFPDDGRNHMDIIDDRMKCWYDDMWDLIAEKELEQMANEKDWAEVDNDTNK